MEARFRNLQMVWGALMLVVVLYAGTAFALLMFGRIGYGAISTGVIIFVSPIAVLGMVGGSLLRRRLVAAIDRGLDPVERMEKYSAANIVALALIEGCGLLIITLSLIVGAPASALVGGAVTVGIMALSGPDRREARLDP